MDKRLCQGLGGGGEEEEEEGVFKANAVREEGRCR